MTVLTTEKLGTTVGAAIVDVDVRAAAARCVAAGSGSSRPSTPTAPWSSGACTSTTPRRWPSARRWDRWRSSAGGRTPRSSGSPSTRRRTRRPRTCGGPSTGTSTAAPTTSRSWPRCSAPTPWPSRAARRSSPAPTPPTRTSPKRRRSATCSLRVVHTIEASQRLLNKDPSPEELAIWRSRPSKEHPLVWTHQSGRRSLVLGATASHVVGMDLDEGRALLDDLLERSTTPDRVYRHQW